MASSLFKRLAKVWSAAAGAARGPASAVAGTRVDLAVFGKHPGWDDHIPDDIGLETARLVEAKQRLYVQGIGGNIDGGAWDKLPASQQVAFGHAFAWRPAAADGVATGDRELLVGRLWHSSDGKGRERYPMVVCVAMTNPPALFAAHEVFPLVDSLVTECAAARTESAVRAAVERAREALRDRLSSPSTWSTVIVPPPKPPPPKPDAPKPAAAKLEAASPPPEAPSEVVMPDDLALDSEAPDGNAAAVAKTLPDDAPGVDNEQLPSSGGSPAVPPEPPPFSGPPLPPLAFLADQPEMGPGHQGLLRLMYLIRQEMAPFRSDGAHAKPRGGFSAVKPQQARVPACDEHAGAAALRWLEFLATRLNERAPILVVVPVTSTPGAGWADLIAGEATATQLYCLRAGPEALPFSTEIPYNLPPEFVISAEQEIDASRAAAGR